MKNPTTYLPLAAFAFALHFGLTGCSKHLDPAKYSAVQWTNSINAPGLSESEFTRLFGLRAAAQIPKSKVCITGPRDLTIKLARGGEIKQFLGNAWADARARPSERADVCARYLSALMDTQKLVNESSAPLDTNQIVAVVRDDQFLRQMEDHGTKADKVLVEPFVADLRVAYGCDSERGMTYLMEKDVAKLGLGFSELRQLALTNLRRILTPPKRMEAGPLFMMVADGNYESSLLLSDRLWESQASAVNGQLVAAVPSRDVLMFTGSGSPDGLKALRESVDKMYREGSHVISKTLLVRRNGKWEKFE